MTSPEGTVVILEWHWYRLVILYWLVKPFLLKGNFIALNRVPMRAKWHHSKFKRIWTTIICLNTILTFCHIVFGFASYRINLHISSCLTKKENGKITPIGICGLYLLLYTYVILWHIRSPLLILIFISVAFPQTIRDWNALPDSLISSAEGAEDGVAKFTSP